MKNPFKSEIVHEDGFSPRKPPGIGGLFVLLGLLLAVLLAVGFLIAMVRG
jgi:hypothetical protein